MNDAGEWDVLVAKWQSAHEAALRLALFRDGTLQADRLDEYNRLHEAERAAKQRMDDFIEAFLSRGGG